MKKLWMSWSTGKDSAYALLELKKNSNYQVTGLFTTVTVDYERVSMHSTREVLLKLQAHALGLPLEIIPIPANCSNEIYEARMQELVEKAKVSGVTAMGFGDLYLENIRNYREGKLSNTGIEPVFPLWNRPTNILAQEMIASGIEAVLTCIDLNKLPSSFAGRFFNAKMLEDLPKEIDHCGENGEFHTFVFDSPNFNKPISISIGEKLEREGFLFIDILPAF